MNCNQPFADISELLRVKQGDGEVDKQQDGAQQGERGYKVHRLPQLLTGLDVEKGHDEENDGVEKHREILHWTPGFSVTHSSFSSSDSKIDFGIGGVVLAEGKAKENIRVDRMLAAGRGVLDPMFYSSFPVKPSGTKRYPTQGSVWMYCLPVSASSFFRSWPTKTRRYSG